MAWLNASGNQIAMTPLTIQIDIPAEKVGDQMHSLAAVNWPKVMQAAIQLVIALMTSNPAGIAAALQQLITALMGG